MKVYPVPCGPAANESERKALEYLKPRLIAIAGKDEWFLLTNLAFSVSHQRQSDEIDLIAIGPPGVRVIEIKHWSPQWIDANTGLVEHAADLVTAKARRVGTTLRKRVADLAHVDGVFLLTQDPSKLKRFAGKKVRGVPYHTLTAWKEAIGFDSPRLLTASQVKWLADDLAKRFRVTVDGSLRQLAAYVHLELQTPTEERFHRIYKGVHATRQDKVILHLYDLSASNTTKAETIARREYEALRRLQLYPWAPRILDSFQDAPDYAGEMSFFTVVDPTAPCIKERASDNSWDTKARLSFARDTIRALSELHEAQTGDERLVHRNLTPETILVKHDNSPVLTGFERTKIPTDISVALVGPSMGPWDSTVAPEVRAQGLSAAEQHSDVYSLCASLTRLFPGPEDEKQIREILAKGMAEVPAQRSTLQELDASLSELLGESIPQPPPPPARFWTEGQVVRFQDSDYRIVARLGAGGIGITFKVVEIDRSTQEELGTYVAKVGHNEETGQRVLRSYRLARSHLGRHPALSDIFGVAPEWQENDFITLMEWIQGGPLGVFTGVFPLLADDLQESSSEALALRWLRTICEALDVLHRNELVHGDVSPRNMIVSETELVLIDYDFVAKTGEPLIASGTPLYCSPFRPGKRLASPADDIYALAASFFHVVFDKEPFQYDVQAKDRGLNWEGVAHEEYPILYDFLNKATHPDPAQRFGSAAQALAALNAKEPVIITVPERHANQVDWLRSLLQSYPGSRWGNRETRGLDTEFATQTYVETDIENALYDAIVQRRVRLVILCGNAGDGKTALLQHLATRLGLGDHSSAERILTGRMNDGLVVRINLDGSAAWQERSADDLLDEFLKPFQEGEPAEDIVHLLAINDGRLLEWIERRGETPLTNALYALLDDQAVSQASHIRFISLNQRSLVGSITPERSGIESGFLEKLLDQLYGGDNAPTNWAPCQTCSAQERCEVWRATRVFGPAGLPDMETEAVRTRARQRLFDALQAVHLRGETHITVRELRAALVYILFGIHFCQDYHDYDAGSDAPQAYWERAFSPRSLGRQGEVLRELARFDPALEAHPQIDRRLLRDDDEMDLESARRRAFFEWTEEKIAEIAADPHALDLAQGQHLRLFQNLPIEKNEEEKTKLCARVCRGISRLEDLPPQALDRADVVPLRITPRTPTETAFWVDKPLRAFRLEADLPPETEGLGRLHRQVSLIYRYQNGGEERLRMGADLFHRLLELSDGYQLGDVSTDDTFAHLSIFVQRLVREDDEDDYVREDDYAIFAWNPLQDEVIYKVSAEIKDTGAGVQQPLVIRRLTQGGQG